jgi:signal peptidase I
MDVARGDAAAVAGSAADPRASAAASEHSAWWRELPVLVLVAVLLTLLVRTFFVQAFYIPSGSMEPTLQVGDRVLVSKLSYRFGDVQRGDVIVFDGTGSFEDSVDATPPGLLSRAVRGVGAFFGVSASETDFTKRVIGLPGDHVVCCDAAGRLTVNGVGLDEPYVMPGDDPSTTRFDIVVPAGRLWVMGDHRSDSADSRAHLGDPGGGTVPEKQVIGKAVVRFWPLSRLGSIDAVAGGS